MGTSGKVFTSSSERLLKLQLGNGYTLADPGGAASARTLPPKRDPILSFSHMFLLKCTHIRGWHPPPTAWHPPTGNPGSATDTDLTLLHLEHSLGYSRAPGVTCIHFVKIKTKFCKTPWIRSLASGSFLGL